MKTNQKTCEHVWKTFQHTRGMNPPIVTGTSTWCEKCGVEKPHRKTKDEEQFDRWSNWLNRNGDYR